jgi:hypothetical protein
MSDLSDALDAIERALGNSLGSHLGQAEAAALVKEMAELKAWAYGHPEGEYACTVCGGHGEVQHGGYYVPGEQFCEPPGEERCEACIGSGQREVQQSVAELIKLRNIARLWAEAVERGDEIETLDDELITALNQLGRKEVGR